MGFGQLGNGESSPQPMSEINMTPLVDVMLVLLIIFIVTAPLLTHNIKVNLPQAAAKPSSIQRPVVVTLDRQLRIYLDTTQISREALRGALTREVAKGVPPTVELRADGGVAYQDLIQVMALVQQAGVTRLSFVTKDARR